MTTSMMQSVDESGVSECVCKQSMPRNYIRYSSNLVIISPQLVLYVPSNKEEREHRGERTKIERESRVERENREETASDACTNNHLPTAPAVISINDKSRGFGTANTNMWPKRHQLETR